MGLGSKVSSGRDEVISSSSARLSDSLICLRGLDHVLQLTLDLTDAHRVSLIKGSVSEAIDQVAQIVRDGVILKEDAGQGRIGDSVARRIFIG
ncbi:MAG: hypothetical protein D6758_11880 [Gammaproteobacteria bacterium]|nr:MAG: hypothetical protein D6758_11880 [Gammaproteobacteria bacterium]